MGLLIAIENVPVLLCQATKNVELDGFWFAYKLPQKKHGDPISLGLEDDGYCMGLNSFTRGYNRKAIEICGSIPLIDRTQTSEHIRYAEVNLSGPLRTKKQFWTNPGELDFFILRQLVFTGQVGKAFNQLPEISLSHDSAEQFGHQTGSSFLSAIHHEMIFDICQ